MNRSWPVDALAFEESVESALRDLGGFELTRECETEPTRRMAISATIATLELDQLDPSEGEIEAAAAALAVRAAGRVALPWPLIQRLVAAGSAEGVDAIYPVGGVPRRAEHLDLAGRAVALDVRSGKAWRLEAGAPIAPMPLDPFGVPCELGEEVRVDAKAILTSQVLSAYWVLGALESAVALSSSYSVEREQFGRPIYNFGAIQWRLSDLAVDVSALSELAGFTLSRAIDGEATLADCWALRLQMIEAANRMLTNAHQIFGAIGLCEEHDLVVIDRNLQSQLRRPFGEAQTVTLLAERVGVEGFDLLYPVAPLARNERVAAA